MQQKKLSPHVTRDGNKSMAAHTHCGSGVTEEVPEESWHKNHPFQSRTTLSLRSQLAMDEA